MCNFIDIEGYILVQMYVIWRYAREEFVYSAKGPLYNLHENAIFSQIIH